MKEVPFLSPCGEQPPGHRSSFQEARDGNELTPRAGQHFICNAKLLSRCPGSCLDSSLGLQRGTAASALLSSSTHQSVMMLPITKSSQCTGQLQDTPAFFLTPLACQGMPCPHNGKIPSHAYRAVFPFKRKPAAHSRPVPQNAEGLVLAEVHH